MVRRSDRSQHCAGWLVPLVLLVSACGRPEPGPAPAPPAEPRPAQAEGPEIVIGLIPEVNIFKQVERYEPLGEYLSRRTGTRVRMTVLPRYGNLIDTFVSSGLDGAFFGSFSYALAHRKLGVEVLARPVDARGVSTYHGLIFVRKDSGIRSVGDMRGKRFAFVDKATSAGYLLPLAFFRENGKDYRTYLGETYFAGTHEDAILDVLNGKADAGAAKDAVFERLAREDARVRDELLVLERSPDFPENALAVRKDLDPSLRRKLKETLLTLHDDPSNGPLLQRFGATRFVETTDADYEPVYRYAREIGLDLATYDYRDDR